MTDTGNNQTQSFAHSLQTELHVWLASPGEVTDPAVLDGYAGLLSAEETLRYRKFRFERDRRLYLVSHALLRRALSLYAEVLPSAWQYAVNQHGKPEIAMPELPLQLRFNLSHTPGLAACLVVLDDDCGIDVERISVQRNAQGIAARMFPLHEQRHLATLCGDEYREQFLAYWTLHEAYSKALGVGIARTVNKCGFSGKGIGEYAIRCPDTMPDSGPWVLSVQRPTDDHMLALAVRSAASGTRKIVVRWMQP
jgi:4'-phosphopantetheinyl transferase